MAKKAPKEAPPTPCAVADCKSTVDPTRPAARHDSAGAVVATCPEHGRPHCTKEPCTCDQPMTVAELVHAAAAPEEGSIGAPRKPAQGTPPAGTPVTPAV